MQTVRFGLLLFAIQLVLPGAAAAQPWSRGSTSGAEARAHGLGIRSVALIIALPLRP
jgi:hypothetical protein